MQMQSFIYSKVWFEKHTWVGDAFILNALVHVFNAHASFLIYLIYKFNHTLA